MTNNNTINGRIREIILSAGITDSAFAKRIGVTQSVIASMFQRGTEPSAKVLTSILLTYEDISAEWLLRGKGQMLLSEVTPDPNIERITAWCFDDTNGIKLWVFCEMIHLAAHEGFITTSSHSTH